MRLKRYAILREIIPPAQRQMLRAYVGQLVDRGYFPALDDGQVRLRTAIHNEPTIASMHHGLAALLSDVAGERLLASCCYLGHYVGGALLERHIDRPQCAYNLSIVFGMFGPGGEPEPWPIYLELDGEPVAVDLAVGDGVMYSGTEIYHWRDALPADQRAVICCFPLRSGGLRRRPALMSAGLAIGRGPGAESRLFKMRVVAMMPGRRITESDSRTRCSSPIHTERNAPRRLARLPRRHNAASAN